MTRVSFGVICIHNRYAHKEAHQCVRVQSHDKASSCFLLFPASLKQRVRYTTHTSECTGGRAALQGKHTNTSKCTVGRAASQVRRRHTPQSAELVMQSFILQPVQGQDIRLRHRPHEFSRDAHILLAILVRYQHQTVLHVLASPVVSAVESKDRVLCIEKFGLLGKVLELHCRHQRSLTGKKHLCK